MFSVASRLKPGECIFFACDVQERFRTVIHKFPQLVHSANKLIKASKILDVPLVVTEQYPKALLRTVKELDVSHGTLFEKTKFSMLTPEVVAHIDTFKRRQAVVFGLEGHVCIQQTVLDLLERGYSVQIPCDAISSSSQELKDIALQRMIQAGAIPTSADSVLFELMVDAKHPRFKEISNIVKDSEPSKSNY